jgi:hypothetical protein
VEGASVGSTAGLQIVAKVFHVFDDVAQAPGHKIQSSWFVFDSFQFFDRAAEEFEQLKFASLCLHTFLYLLLVRLGGGPERQPGKSGVPTEQRN